MKLSLIAPTRACSAIVAAALFAAAGCGSSADETLGQSGSDLGTQQGVDYSWARPSPQSLHAAGYTFAARYLSHDTTGKNLSASEAQALIAAGVDVVANWEDSATGALNGYGQGVADAQTAEAQAAADGMPAGRPIYFSVDFDATPGDQVPINAYFDGVISVLGLGRTGAYGGYYVIKRLFDAGKITFGWQAYAWSGGQWDARAQMRQVNNGAACSGGCDIDQSIAADFGQWHAAPPPPPPPRGALDQAVCGSIAGWAQDETAANTPINVDLYFDAPAGKPGSGSLRVLADNHRNDLCTAIKSCDHGFALPPPAALMDGKPHDVYAYAIAASGKGPNPLLPNAPKSFTCAPPAFPTPPGIKRWVTNPASFTSWKFGSLDVARETDAEVATYPQGADVPEKPTVVIADDGSPSVWVVDGAERRHVVNPTSLTAWRFAVVKWPAAQVNALMQGPDWPLAPFLFVADGQPAVYILDVAPTVPPGPGDQDGGVVGEGGAPIFDSDGGIPVSMGPTDPNNPGAANGASASGGCSLAPGGPTTPGAGGAVFVVLGLIGLGRRRRDER